MSRDMDVSPRPAPQYARFSRRLRAMLIDWILALIVIYGAVLLATAAGNDDFSRGLGIGVVAALLLYEPILVSRTGSTVGHYLTNLRVVDDRGGGNIGFARACARSLIKGALGLYSFVILAATRRNQALHDLLTRSTVQIRDPAKASPGQYLAERTEFAAAGMPPPSRRIAVTGFYLLLIAIVYVVIIEDIVARGAISHACIDGNFCSGGERILSLMLGAGLLGICAVCVAQGWRGRLVGARGTLAGDSG
jgi:uncharacterized RDD family membrane protein YckC